MEQTSVSETFFSRLAPYACFQLPVDSPWLNLRYFLVLILCVPFSLFRQSIDILFLYDNVLHKLEILYSNLTLLCFKTHSRSQSKDLMPFKAFKPPVVSAAVCSLANSPTVASPSGHPSLRKCHCRTLPNE